MRALTLHRPWPWAIIHLDPPRAKRIENRSWPPPRAIVGAFLAIHAGLEWDAERLHLIARAARRRPPPIEQHPTGIVGVARVVGCRTPETRARRDRWYLGQYGWLLADVHALAEPIPCRGYQGIWTVPEREAALVREQLPKEIATCV